MSEALLNPNAVIGSNSNSEADTKDYAKFVTERLVLDYGELAKATTEILAEARALPVEVTDDETAGKLGHVVTRMRDLSKRLKSHHDKEKEPYKRAGEAVDQWFFGLMERLGRRQNDGKAGGSDILEDRVGSYVKKKAEAERRRRDEEERRARAEAAAAEQRRQAAEQERLAAEAAANRARKPENIENFRNEAQAHAVEAQQARAAERVAIDNLRDAQQAANAKTADLVRTRTDSGVLITAQQVGYVEITDPSKMDAVLLWPFVKDEHKLAALKAYAKITNHKKQMSGCIIEMRDKTVIK